MKANITYIIVFIVTLHGAVVLAQDTATTALPLKNTLKAAFSGELSWWAHYNPGNVMQYNAIKRYIPQLNVGLRPKNYRLFDMECSANLSSSTDVRTFDSVHFNWDAAPYRLWVRYSTKQSEIRLGKQRINFGSATLLRPLMWFEQLDPRDPQQLTQGVWGILGRYYFLNNANIWLWGLYGNKDLRPWDIGAGKKNIPEAGGRLQLPVPKGEVAFTYHHRTADMTFYSPYFPAAGITDENRYAFDARFDVEVGLWCEAAWINKTKNSGIFTNQHMLTLGSDYTFGLGNGLNVVLEHLVFSTGEKSLKITYPVNFTASSLNYPLSIDDNLNMIAFYDWKNKNIYTFAGWKHQFGKIKAHLMLYSNPEVYVLPLQGNAATVFAGKGAQIMIIYKH